MCFETLGQMGFGWFNSFDMGSEMVMTVMTVMTVVAIVAIMAEVHIIDDIVFAMMGMSIQLTLMSVVSVLVEPGWMAVMVRHLKHSWVIMSFKRWVGNRMHESLLFHFPRSTAVPYLPLCEPSWIWCGHHPVFGVTTVTPDEVETLATWLIPGSRASFFNFDAANNFGPAHFTRKALARETVDVNTERVGFGTGIVSLR